MARSCVASDFAAGGRGHSHSSFHTVFVFCVCCCVCEEESRRIDVCRRVDVSVVIMSDGDSVGALRETVLSLLRTLKPPVHIAQLSMMYAKKVGHSIKQDHKGGMLRFVKDVLQADVVIMGEGNDSFLHPATPATRATQWIRECVSTNGPILVSMVGRLYHEAHGVHFNEALSTPITRFMHEKMSNELSFETQKGQEVLVDLRRRGESRAFIAEGSKKQRKEDKKRKLADESGAASTSGGDKKAAGDTPAPAGDDPTVVRGGRLRTLGLPGAYANPDERLLLIGEADFSFAAALVRLCDEGVRRRRLTATSYDDRATLRAKYGGEIVDANVAKVKAVGASVLHSIDASTLSDAPELRARGPFDLLVFMFPHTGGDAGLASSIEENRALLRATVMREAPKMLRPDGELHITLVHRYPYTAWLDGLKAPPARLNKGTATSAAKGGGAATSSPATALEYLGAHPFEFGCFGGYQHRATSKVAGGNAGALDVMTRCTTHVWRASATESPSLSEASAGGLGDHSSKAVSKGTACAPLDSATGSKTEHSTIAVEQMKTKRRKKKHNEGNVTS